MIERRLECFLITEYQDGRTRHLLRKNVYRDGVLVGEIKGGPHAIFLWPGQDAETIAEINAENCEARGFGTIAASATEDIILRARRTHTPARVAAFGERRADPEKPHSFFDALADAPIAEVRENPETGTILYKVRDVLHPWLSIAAGDDVGQFIDALRKLSWREITQKWEEDVGLRCARVHTPEKIAARNARLAEAVKR